MVQGDESREDGVKGELEQHTLSVSAADSTMSSSASASSYDPLKTSSSIWSDQGFMHRCHMDVPSAAAVVLSVEVVAKNKDVCDADGVKSRMVALPVGGGEGAEVKGNGKFWELWRENEEQI